MLKKRLLQKRHSEDLKAINENLQEEIKEATRFIQEIENGNLEAEIDDSNTGNLVESLLRMRDEMKRIKVEEDQRNWTTTGLAKFADILRNTDENDGKSIYDIIISNLVKYMDANQGGLFALNEEDKDDVFIEMLSCFAYDRQKFIEKKILLGEGLVGQVYLEGKTTYLKIVPENYINITSGLGKATPKNILIVPLKINDTVFGVLELASFKIFDEYKINFVEKLGENIASAISNAKNMEKTKVLLESSQMNSEMLRAQEEEMRQNMEELQATQEQMQRKQADVEKLNKKLTNNENVLRKALEKAKEGEEKLKEKNRIVAEREEQMNLRLEELKLLREEGDKKEKALEAIKQKLESNQEVLVRATKNNQNVISDLKIQVKEKDERIKELEKMLHEKA